MSSHEQHDGGDAEARLRKLEEAQAFSEHQGDQLSGEIERVFAQIKRLSERLDVIERRMSMLGDDKETE